MQTQDPLGGIPAVLLGAGLVVAGLSLLKWIQEHSSYDPVEEAQKIARRAIGIED